MVVEFPCCEVIVCAESLLQCLDKGRSRGRMMVADAMLSSGRKTEAIDMKGLLQGEDE